MTCSKCKNQTCTCYNPCTAAKPYYSCADVCPEDHANNVYIDRFSFGMCSSTSWNIPQCGFGATINVGEMSGAAVGAYIWHEAYGYFQINSVDASKGQVVVVNNCTEGNAPAGTQVPACTCFVVTVPPFVQSTGSQSCLALDFTAPAEGDCILITVTNLDNIQVGDEIQIGTARYIVDELNSLTTITICNEGFGFVPGTAVVAKDAYGNYQYCFIVVSNCCTTIDAKLAAAIDTTPVVSAEGQWGGISTGSANAQAISTTPVTTALGAGQVFRFKAGYTNTGATTLDVNGLGPLAINTPIGPLVAGDLLAGGVYTVVNYGSAYYLVNRLGSTSLYKLSTDLLISNTAAELGFVAVAIPGNTVVTGKSLVYKVYGQFLNNSGAPVVYTFRFKLNGTTLFTSALTLTNDAAVQGIAFELRIAGDTAANQKMILFSNVGGVSPAATVQSSDIAGVVDMSVATIFAATLQMASASVLINFKASAQQLDYN